MPLTFYLLTMLLWSQVKNMVTFIITIKKQLGILLY